MIGLIALTAALFLLAPNLTEQAEEAGSFQLSEQADSQRAATILESADVSGQTISLVIELESELDEAGRQRIADLRTEIEALGGSTSPNRPCSFPVVASAISVRFLPSISTTPTSGSMMVPSGSTT